MRISAEELKAERLNEVFKLHETWLHSDGKRGKRAVITNTDMGHINLSNVNLSHAILTGNYMKMIDMRDTDLSHAILTGNDISYTDMRHANLSHAVLRRNNMTGTNMGFTVMIGTCIEDCIIPMACPSDGAFIGWKVARIRVARRRGEKVLVKLLIPEDAKRSSATGRKCRCDKARVIEILSMKDNKEFESAVSDYDKNFIYKKGETVCEPNFCEDRFNECAKGIHFFIDRKEAENY